MTQDRDPEQKHAMMIADLTKQIIGDTPATFPIDVRIAAMRCAAYVLEQEMQRQAMVVAVARALR